MRTNNKQKKKEQTEDQKLSLGKCLLFKSLVKEDMCASNRN